MISCWTYTEIPPWSLFFAQEILQPSVESAPTAVVYAGAKETLPVDPFTQQGTYYWLAYNFRPDAITNGIRVIPKNSLFDGDFVGAGIHWLAYHEGSDPESLWWNPTAAWNLTDEDIPGQVGPWFRRVGRADEVNRCIPVLMVPRVIARSMI